MKLEVEPGTVIVTADLAGNAVVSRSSVVEGAPRNSLGAGLLETHELEAVRRIAGRLAPALSELPFENPDPLRENAKLRETLASFTAEREELMNEIDRLRLLLSNYREEDTK